MRNLVFAIGLNVLGPAAFIAVMLTGFGTLNAEAGEFGYDSIFQMCREQPQALTGGGCTELAVYTTLKPIAWIVGILGIALPVFNFAAPSILGATPGRLAQIYPKLFPFTLGISLTLVVLGLGFLGVAGHIFMSWVLEIIWWYAYVAFLIGAAIVIARSATAVGKAFENQAGLEFGVKATREETPALFEIVDEMAEKVGSPPPVNLVVGASPNFYITDAPLQIAPSDELLTGETVFISATLAEIMTREELASIVAHELMHYKGADLELTRKFYPIYRRLEACLDELSRSNTIMATPVLCNLNNLLGGFATAERKISRERELAADAGAAQATSSTHAAGALLKASLFSSLWTRMLTDHAVTLSQGEHIKDGPRALYGYLVYEVDEHTIEAHINDVLETRLAHPVDTHPTLAERLANWGVSINELQRDYYTDYDSDRSSGLFTDEFVEKITDSFEAETYARARFRIPEPDDPHAAAERRVNQAIYGIVEHAIRSDGEVQPEEVIRAENLCRNQFGGFSSLIFRERLHGDVEPAPLEDLVETVFELLPADKRPVLKALVDEIIEADGTVEPAEAEMRDRFNALFEAAQARVAD